MEDEAVEVPAEIRPDWWVPASIVVRGIGGLFGIVYQTCTHMADVMVGYSNYQDGRIEFHNAAAAELEKLTEESDG